MKKTLLLLSCGLLAACQTTSSSNSSLGTYTQAEIIDYVCENGQAMSASFDQQTAFMELNGITYMLSQQEAASGIAYSNDHVSIRGKGEALTLKTGASESQCQRK